MGIGKYPFKDPYPSAVAKVIEQQERLQKAFAPSLAFQKHMQKITKSVSAFDEIIQDQKRVAQFFKDIDPLKEIRPQLTAFDEMSKRMQVWSTAVEAQNLLKLPDHVTRALQGIRINNELLRLIQSVENSTKLDDVVSSLQQESIYLGEYGFLDSEDDEGFETKIILPENIEESYKAVNFLPITIFEKILKDPTLMREISSRDFEYFVAEIVEKLGFSNVTVTPRSGDGGRDIIATKEVNEIPLLFSFECKQYSKKRKIQLETMRALLGTVVHTNSKANIGVLVTTSSFTKGVRDFITSEAMIDGKDFHDLVQWIKEVSSNKSVNKAGL
jgi:HJR/Mrr/RecB family endonuclease